MRTKKILLWLGILSLAGLILSVFAQSIENIQLVPNLDISRFDDYQLNVTTSGDILSGEFLITAINGQGGNCIDYYASGWCASSWNITIFTGTLINSGSETWIYDDIRPDYIYPQIFFAPDEITWNNEPDEVLMSRNSYELMYLNNPFTMESDMSFFVELNIRPRSTANSQNILIYLIEKNKDISFFWSERRTDPGVELIGSFSRTALPHHTHTANSSHYLIPLSTNGDGTIGTKNIDISNNFRIALVADTGLPSKGRYLRYQPNTLCQNTNWRYEGDLDDRSTALQSWCPDAHIHIARRGTHADSLQAEITIYATGDTIITGEWTGSFQPLPNLAPNATSFITPTSGSYTGDTGIYSWNISISRYPTTDPNGDSVTYNIYLTDTWGNNLGLLTWGISTTGFTRDSTSTGDGTYNLKWEACDGSLCSTFNLSENFEIDNVADPDTTPPSFNITSGHYFSGDVDVEITDEYYSGTIVTYSWSDTLYTTTGFTLTGEGYYFLTAYDTTGNNNSIGFFIDLTSPTFTGVISGTTYYTGVSIEFFDNNDGVTATLSGGDYTGWIYVSGTLITTTGEYIFIVTDSAGNSTGANFTILDPDTVAPTWYVSYDISTPISGDVIATLTGLSEPVTVTNNSWSIYYTFTGNGSFTFEFEDDFGNTWEAIATVTRIDKTIPIITLNGTAIVYIEFGDEYIESWAIRSDNGSTGDVSIISGAVDTGTLGTYILEYLYSDSVQTGSITRTVYVQDTIPPTATVEYTPASWARTSGNVIAVLTGFNEPVTITNNGWSWIYLFTTNGSFTFEFQDNGGNTGETTAIVDRIDTTPPIITSTGTIVTTTGTATVSNIAVSEPDSGLASAFFEYSGVNNSMITWNLQLATWDLNNLTWFISGLDHNATYFYTITFTDNVGNNSFITGTYETIIDRNIIYTEVRSGNVLSGIHTNLSSVTNDNVTDFSWLELEIPSIGKIEILTGINLTDPGTQDFLQSLWTTMIMENGYINFIVYDTSTLSGSAFKDIPATLTMRLTQAQYSNGTGSVDNIVVRDNNWNIIESSSILSNFFCTGSVLTGIEQECSFNTLHFTSFGTKPTLPFVTIYSDNSNPWYAKLGNTIILSFTGSEPLTGVSAIIASNGATIRGTGIDRTGNYTLVGGESEGNTSFSIDFEDFYNNTGITVTTVTDASQVIIDLTDPTVTNITSGTYFSGSITPTIVETHYSGASLNGSDYTSGTVISAEGNYELIITDLAGNSFAVSFTIDTTEPTFGWIISWSYYTGSVTITFDDFATLNGTLISSGYTTGADGSFELIISDLAGNSTGATFTIDNTPPEVSNITSGQRFSGNITPTIVETHYSWATLNGSEYTGTEITADGNYELIVTDLAGNIFAVSFSIDQTPPTASIEYTPSSRTNGNVIAILTGFNEPVTITNNGGSDVYTFATNGTFTFTFEDHIGNTWETTATVTRIDTTAPTVNTAYISAGNTGNNWATLYYNGTITIKADVSDTGWSELNTISCKYTIDWTTWNTANYDTGYCYMTGLNPTTDIQTQFSIQDIAGNLTTGTARNYLYDNTAPTTTDNANSTTGAIDVTITLTPVDTGINSITTYYCVDTAGICTPTNTGTNVSVTWVAGTVTHKYVRYYSIDNLGNTEAIKISPQINIDKENPYLTGTTTFSSNNTTNSGYAKIGNTITITFTSHETLIDTPILTIVGWNTSTGIVTNIGGNNYSATYIMESIDNEGTISFDITMTDLVGNTATETIYSTIIFDKTAPAWIIITAPTIDTYLKGDPDVYTITWTTGTEIHYWVKPLLLEYSVTNFVSTTNITTETENDWSYAFIFPNTLNTFAKIRILATDLAGNIAYFTGNQFSIDNTPPTDITITYPGLYLKWWSGYLINRNGWIDANPETIILSYTTNGTTFTTICTKTNNEQNCTWTTPNLNSSTVQLRTVATDKVGMTKQWTTPTFIVDSTRPTTIIFTDSNSNRRNTNATATGTSTDVLAGLRSTGILYKTDTAFTESCDWWTTIPPTFSTEGYHTGYACISDNAGNIRTGQQSYKIDKTLPNLQLWSWIITNTAVSINITGTDTLAGISWYLRSQISWPGTIIFTNTTSEDPTVNADTDGEYILQVLVKDNANNITTGTIEFIRDTTAPILTWAASVLNTTSQTPNYNFTGNEWGTITYSGWCTSTTTTALSGNNTITFSALSNWTYTSCQLQVTDEADNASTRLDIPNFTVSYSPPSWGGGWWWGWWWMPICTSSQLECINNIYAIKAGQYCQWGDLGEPCETDICVDGDYSGNPNDGICYDPTKIEINSGIISTGVRKTYISPYSQELTDAYSYAYGVKITTVPKIERANLNGVLIRSHLAKMMSEYAIKVLGKTPDTSRSCIFKDMSKQTEEFQKYAKLACQLGLMGLKTDGTPADTFNPEDQVNRAIFGTTLSRALFGGTYNGGQNRYAKHLEALKTNAVMNFIDKPFNREIRGYVMLMMMRADQKLIKSSYNNFISLRGSKIFVPNTWNTTNTSSQFTQVELDFIKNINKAYQFTEGYTLWQNNAGVKYLQYFLKAKTYYTWTINGVNNSTTVAALFQFQFDNNIVDNETDQGAGYLGPTTRETINPLLKKLLNP